MARRRDLVTVLDDHERDIRRLRATLARIGSIDLSPYLKLDGTTPMTGNLDLNNNNIVNTDALYGDQLFTIGTVNQASRLSLDETSGDVLFYRADGVTSTLQWDESDLQWEFKDKISLAGDLIFTPYDTGFDYENQGVALNLGSKAVADDGVIPFIDFYSGSSIIAARIISSTDSGSAYSGGLRFKAATVTVDGHLKPDGDNSSDLGDSTTSFRDVYAFNIKNEGGTTVIDTSGVFIPQSDIRMHGDQLFFNYGAETTSYLLHTTTGNYFSFVQGNSEGYRFYHNGSTTVFDMYGTSYSMIRNSEGTHLYIDNEQTDQNIYLRTDPDGGGVHNRVVIQGADSEVRFFTETGDLQGAFRGYQVNSYGSNNKWAGMYSATSGSDRLYFQVNGVDRGLFTSTPTFAPADNGVTNLGAGTLRWNTVYATNATINTSDERLKDSDGRLDDAFALGLVRTIEPLQGQWKDGTRKHWWFGAQQVRDSIIELGYDPGDFGVFIDPTVKVEQLEVPPDPRGGAVHNTNKRKITKKMLNEVPLMLRPVELVPVLWSGVQQLDREVQALQARIEALEAVRATE